MLRVGGHAPPTSGSPQLKEASNCTGIFALGLLGVTVKLGVGPDTGGRITPGGTNRICTLCETAVKKSDPVGVARMSMQVPGRNRQVPKMPFEGLGGAV